MNPHPLFGRLIVSCQASDGDAFRQSESMARFALAAVDAGAAGIRANGVEDIRAILAVVSVPVIGIQKSLAPDGGILITGTFEEAKALVDAGASIIALDCTTRGRQYGAFGRLQRIQHELGVRVMADIATVEEAVAAVEAGADWVASTMRGYTAETASVDSFEPAFIAALCKAVAVPVLAEGRIADPREAAAAIRAGAFAVIVGSAITRPQEITKRFVAAVEKAKSSIGQRHVLAVDMGGTNTKYGVVTSGGTLLLEGFDPTPAEGGRDVLVAHLKRVAAKSLRAAREQGLEPDCIGLATAGWVNHTLGEIAYATENLPGWTGTRIAAELQEATGLPVSVENDANALAVGERAFGAGRGVADFICITLGTGLGGGCYVGGRLNRGAHFFANALGHIPIETEGLACNCGLRGCLERYTNAAALLRYAGGKFANAEELIGAARLGDSIAAGAIDKLAYYLAVGCAAAVQLLDPSMIVLSGGLTQGNDRLLETFRAELSRRVTVWPQRALTICLSQLGYHGGVLGAAAVALEKSL